ncbi:hypothetical protein ABKN59_001526 [Abortiporus biennis]
MIVWWCHSDLLGISGFSRTDRAVYGPFWRFTWEVLMAICIVLLNLETRKPTYDSDGCDTWLSDQISQNQR